MSENPKDSKKIYLPDIIKSGMGEPIQIVELKDEGDHISMIRAIDLMLINYNVGQITIKDAVYGAEVYDAIKNSKIIKEDGTKIPPEGTETEIKTIKCTELSEEAYEWLFDAIDEPLTIIFGINSILVKEQLFQDEPKEKIRKIKNEIKPPD